MYSFTHSFIMRIIIIPLLLDNLHLLVISYNLPLHDRNILQCTVLLDINYMTSLNNKRQYIWLCDNHNFNYSCKVILIIIKLMSSSTVFHRLFSSSDDIDITLDERIRNEEDSQKRKFYRIIITIVIILIAIFPYICIPILFVLVSKKKDTTNNVRNIWSMALTMYDDITVTIYNFIWIIIFN